MKFKRWTLHSSFKFKFQVYLLQPFEITLYWYVKISALHSAVCVFLCYFGSEQLHMERRVSTRSQLLTVERLWSWIKDTAKPMREKGKIPCLRHSRMDD